MGGRFGYFIFVVLLLSCNQGFDRLDGSEKLRAELQQFQKSYDVLSRENQKLVELLRQGTVKPLALSHGVYEPLALFPAKYKKIKLRESLEIETVPCYAGFDVEFHESGKLASCVLERDYQFAEVAWKSRTRLEFGAGWMFAAGILATGMQEVPAGSKVLISVFERAVEVAGLRVAAEINGKVYGGDSVIKFESGLVTGVYDCKLDNLSELYLYCVDW